jgi:hypothetical protein
MRVNPEGPGVMLCEWPRSITAMTNKKKVTKASREVTKRRVGASNEGRMSVVSVSSCIGPMVDNPNIASASPELIGEPCAARGNHCPSGAVKML